MGDMTNNVGFCRKRAKCVKWEKFLLFVKIMKAHTIFRYTEKDLEKHVKIL